MANQPSVLDAFLPDPNAIQEEQNQNIDKQLTGTLSQRGSAVGQLFARMLAGNPAVQNATTIRQTARDALSSVGPQGGNESDLDYQLRTTHAMYNAIAPFDSNTAMKLADRLLTLKEMQNQQALLTERTQAETQATIENRQTKGTLIVGNPKTGDEYGSVGLFNDNGAANPDWQSQRDKLLQAHPGSVWRTEEQWAQEKAALEAQKVAAKLTVAQMKGNNLTVAPGALDLMAETVMRNPQALRQFASYGAQGQDIRDQIMAQVSQKLKDMGMSPGEWYGMTAMIHGQQVAINKLAPLMAQTQANESVAINNADRIEALAAKVNTSKFSSLNGFLQWAESQKGNEDAAELRSVVTTFQMEAARILTASPSGAGVVSDSARHELAQVADGTLAPSALKRVLERVKYEIGLRVAGYKTQMEQASQYMSTMGGAQTQPGAGPQGGGGGPAPQPAASGMPSAADIDAELARRAGK